jgi:hypothetical protein
LRHRFSVAGEPRELLAALAALPVDDVAIAPPSLEESFRHLYGEVEAA